MFIEHGTSFGSHNTPRIYTGHCRHTSAISSYIHTQFKRRRRFRQASRTLRNDSTANRFTLHKSCRPTRFPSLSSLFLFFFNGRIFYAFQSVEECGVTSPFLFFLASEILRSTVTRENLCTTNPMAFFDIYSPMRLWSISVTPQLYSVSHLRVNQAQAGSIIYKLHALRK